MKRNLLILVIVVLFSGCSSTYRTTEGFSEVIINEELNPSINNQIEQPIIDSLNTRDDLKSQDPEYLKKQEADFRKALEKTNAIIVRSFNNDLYIYIPTSDMFGFGSSSIQPTVYAYDILNKIAFVMWDQEFSNFIVSIYQTKGDYNDPNFNIIEARSRTVLSYLLTKKLPPDKFTHIDHSVFPVVGVDTTYGLVGIQVKNEK